SAATATSTDMPPAPTAIPPSPTPVCTDDLDYLQDLTIPDGSLMRPGESIDKRWQVRNSGSCNWDQRYSLRLVSGDAMGTDGSVLLYPARAGTEATLQITFTAPQEPGTYECQWQAANPDGTPFGDTFYMQIVVGG
ncbi:MAG TPA: NBR1-Ig-like domain-containing protein, partial [Anaerolineales bacterium]|nr:NBR1-Ig-like domain-containing protein [Anaerolineales bacterium]